MPKLIEFLGHILFDIPHENLGQKIYTYRQFLGLSQRDLAHQIGVYLCTIRSWEKGKHKPTKRLEREFAVFFSSGANILFNIEHL